MKRIALFAALALSLLVPTGAAAIVLAITSAPVTQDRATSWDKVELFDMFKETARLDAQSTAATPGTIAELRRIARRAEAWAGHFPAEPVWEEFAIATSDYAALLADASERPKTISRDRYERVLSRIRAAYEALPDEIPLN